MGHLTGRNEFVVDLEHSWVKSHRRTNNQIGPPLSICWKNTGCVITYLLDSIVLIPKVTLNSQSTCYFVNVQQPCFHYLLQPRRGTLVRSLLSRLYQYEQCINSIA